MNDAIQESKRVSAFVAVPLCDLTSEVRTLNLREDSSEEMSPVLRKSWAAAGSEDTELGVNMEPEVCHGTTEVYARVQA